MKKKSIFVSAAGFVIPAAVFVVLIPKLIADFGVERFGFISLFWIILGAASILDVGIARALTNFVAKNSGNNNRDNLGKVWNVFFLALVWGTVAGLICAFSMTWYFQSASNLHEIIKIELLDAVAIISVSIPLVVSHAVLRGVLEGFNKFGIVSLTKIIAAGVAAALLYFNQCFSQTMTYAAAVLLFSRIIGVAVVFGAVTRLLPLKVGFYDRDVKKILVFGGWTSVSTFASSIMVYLDRFIAGHFMTPSAYGAYSAVSELVMRFLFIPGSIGAVLYPHISRSSRKKQNELQRKALLYVLVTIVPIALTLNIFGEEILRWWLKIDVFSINFSLVILLLTLGLLVNSLAHVPYATLHGNGHVHLTAKLHMVELIIFVPLLFFSAMKWDLIGLLAAWLSRLVFDCFGLFLLNRAVVNNA